MTPPRIPPYQEPEYFVPSEIESDPRTGRFTVEIPTSDGCFTLECSRSKYALRIHGGTCGVCRRQSLLETSSCPSVFFFPLDFYAQVQCLTCVSQRKSLSIYTLRIALQPKGAPAHLPEFLLTRFRVHPAIPSDVAEDYRQASLCFTVQAYPAAATMARRAQETAMRRHGAKGDNLVELIKDLLQKGRISDELSVSADIVREVGKHGAHSTDRKVTGAEAYSALWQSDLVVSWLYRDEITESRIVPPG